MAVEIQEQRGKKMLVMVMVAVVFASLIGFVATAQAVISQGDTTVRAGNTFYAYVKSGERMRVVWNGTKDPSVTNSDGSPVSVGGDGYTGRAARDGVWRVTLQKESGSTNGYTYDMSVREGTAEKKGRIWVYEDVIFQRWQAQFEDLEYFGVSDLGYIYQINMSKTNGIDSKIALRSSGAAPDDDCNVQNRSFESGYVDCGDKYRLFFEDPRNSGLPETAQMGDSTIPVLPDLVSANQLKSSSKVAFTPKSDKVGGSFTVSSHPGFSGTAELQIDANNNGSYGDAVDVEKTIVVNAGKAAAWAWDGKNANGVEVRAGARARVVVNRGGEAHLLLVDGETFGGLTMTRLNGEGSPDSMIRWDDSKLTEARGGNPTPAKSCVNGCNSKVSGGLHGWSRGSAIGDDPETSSWGDGRVIDNWSYVSVDATSPAIALPALHTLTFDDNGGSLSGVSSINRSEGLAWGSLPTATQANMDFLGWFTAKTGGTKVTSSSVATDSLTVYAQWTPTARTLTFDANGGTISGAKSIDKPHGSPWGTLSTATLANEDFLGWYTAETGGTKVTSATLATKDMTVYAHWTPTERTLTFDANGGTLSGAKSITKPHGTAWGTLSTATQANMDFLGWYTAETGGIKVTSATLASRDIIVYAHWEPTERTLTFDANGGTLSGSKSISKPHGSAWGTLSTATQANKDFLGWYTAETGGTKVTSATVATKDITVYAQWEPTERTLTFDPNGGSVVGSKSISKPHGSAWGTLSTATQANEDFLGWYTARTGGTKVTSATLATKDIIVYAQWTPTDRTLTFDANGGTISGAKSITQPHGTAWGTLSTATQANKDFLGWYTAKSGGTKVTSSSVATGDITVYAQWEPTERTLTFDANGGTLSGAKSISKPHGSPWGTLSTATQANKDFEGWYTAKTGGTEVTAATLAAGDITVYAQWTPTPRTLTFDVNGGTLSGVKSITKPHGTAWGTLSTATLANKDFLGWYTAKTGGTEVTAATVATANITVYAQWEPTPRTLTFDANGGTLSGVKSITKPHGSPWGTLSTATQANKDFEGWYTTKTGGTEVTAATVATGNITVYAQWTPTPRTLTFDANGGTVNGAKSITQPHGSPWGTLSTATQVNKDFLGWYTAKTGGTEVTSSTLATGNITVYAQWTPTPRTLTFDANGGAVSGATSITQPHGSPWGTLSTASLTNNDFLGWYTAKTGGTEVTAATVATANITVYAQWTPTPRTLMFDANGGTVNGAKSITQPHGSPWGTLSTASLTNSDFLGWYTAKTGGTEVTAATVATANITVYAHWTPTPRTLTFDATGGSIGGSASITKPHGSPWGTLSTATLANKDFLGWYTAKTGGTEVTAATVATGDITVYAQWTPTPRTLTFDTAGGTLSGVKSITQPHGEPWGTLSTATLANNDFQGWFTARTGGTQVTAATVAAGNITVYAQWKLTPRTLTFDANGGTVSGVKSITQPHGSPWGTLSTATLANNDFQGWFTAKTGGTQVTAATVAAGNITVYAQWKLTPRTITFDATGGSITGDTSITKPHGSPWGTLPTASASGKVFLGWYTAKAGGVQVTSSTLAAGNITVYAQWRPAKFNVVFDGNAQMGKITGSTPSVNVDSGCTTCLLPANGFSKTTGAPELIDHDGGETAEVNSTFLGWSLDPLSRKANIADRAVAGNLSMTDGATVRLYAVWDDAPRFIITDYPDRFFTLEQAKSGVITEAELLRTVTATDKETNPLVHKTRAQVSASGSDVGVTLFDYDATDYSSLTNSAVVTATYKVKDEMKHVAFLRIRVTVNDGAPLAQSEVQYLRGISPDFADKDAAEGGLSAESLWKTDPTRQEALTKAMEGGATTTYCLNADALAELRSQLGGGLGNSVTPDGLASSEGVLRDQGACE